MTAAVSPRPYTIKQLAERWQCSRDSVERLIKDGKLPCLKLSPKVIRIPAAVVEEFEQTAALASSDPANPAIPAGQTSTSDGSRKAQASRQPSGSQHSRLMKG